jgi:hypothetical protein
MTQEMYVEFWWQKMLENDHFEETEEYDMITLYIGKIYWDEVWTEVVYWFLIFNIKVFKFDQIYT